MHEIFVSDLSHTFSIACCAVENACVNCMWQPSKTVFNVVQFLNVATLRFFLHNLVLVPTAMGNPRNFRKQCIKGHATLVNLTTNI